MPEQAPHKFQNMLVLNQWLINLFGIDPLREHKDNGKKVRPFHVLSKPLRAPRIEGMDKDNLHLFYHAMVGSDLFWNEHCRLSKEQLLVYEENIVRHTKAINEKRDRPIVWKYYQWLTLLFAEVYLDWYFNRREDLLKDLNDFVKRFNSQWESYADVEEYTMDDLNKVCIQSATGSGKTLLMHINLAQFRHYAEQAGKANEMSRVILITPNSRLSEQHVNEFAESGIEAGRYLESRGGVFETARGLNKVDVLEIHSLKDKEGPNTIATRSLGDQNLLFVDEGHRGLSGTSKKKKEEEEGTWLRHRASLCAKGFTFEYSATFREAVGDTDFAEIYAKAVLFDYAYRWFYEDGYGKDYKIDNLPDPTRSSIKLAQDKKKTKLEHSQAVAAAVMPAYLMACLLKFYQQLRLYEERKNSFTRFNIEKPLWVFVGNTVSAKETKDDKIVASHVARIVVFLAEFLTNREQFEKTIEQLLIGKGQDTGLLDDKGNDIFHGAFRYLSKCVNEAGVADSAGQWLYSDILRRLFQCPSGGDLVLERVKGDSGEVVLRCGQSETPFGLINVGEAKALCDHIEEVAKQDEVALSVNDSDFSEAMFSNVKESSSTINVLLGSKKFIEGWDCWRVSTMGLMHVGKSEGTQIIQLFGRGVRLKGHGWSLKRSGRILDGPQPPEFMEELETLNVFGIEAEFMERFRKFLEDEGLPGNEKRTVISIPLNVTYDVGKRLKVLRPKRKKSDGKEYRFESDGPVPRIGEKPGYLNNNQVSSDWYPRIQGFAVGKAKQTIQQGNKQKVTLKKEQLAFLDFDRLFFDLEAFKRERGWHNLNISKEGIRDILSDTSFDWYDLRLPEPRLKPDSYQGLMLLQQVATELLKRYCEALYTYRRREFIEPRLEYRELSLSDDLFPEEREYQIIVDGDEPQVIQAITKLGEEIKTKKDELVRGGDLMAYSLSNHLFQPLFHVRRNGAITVLPVKLGESEFQFVQDLGTWCKTHKKKIEKAKAEIFLLRNLSSSKGVGFFEAEGFRPDFIMWILHEDRQHVAFIEPHGMIHEGLGSRKVQFYQRIKEVQARLHNSDPSMTLDSFILSWTKYPQLRSEKSKQELEAMNVLFMREDDEYLEKIFRGIEDAPALV